MLLVFLCALVTVGDHAMHINCTGRGQPTVVIEGGLGETASDWSQVQQRVARHTRVCTYDRAGYGESAPGPFPRTFDQLNFELKLLLEKAGERGPFVLAGHSYGGPVVRHFAELYPDLVAGLVLIDASHEDQQVFYGGAWHRLREGARGTPIPKPRLDGSEKDADLKRTEDSQKEWSVEYFAQWHDHPQTGLLGAKPVIILARNWKSADADAARERVLLQLSLASLSSDAIVQFAGFDHDMQKTIPDLVAKTILRVVEAARTSATLLK